MPDNNKNKDADFHMDVVSHPHDPPKPDTAMHRAVVVASAAGVAAGKAVGEVNSLGVPHWIARFANSGLMFLAVVLLWWILKENSRINTEFREDARQERRDTQHVLQSINVKLETLNLLMNRVEATRSRLDAAPRPRPVGPEEEEQ
jgi:hypothetical protein